MRLAGKNRVVSTKMLELFLLLDPAISVEGLSLRHAHTKASLKTTTTATWACFLPKKSALQTLERYRQAPHPFH